MTPKFGKIVKYVNAKGFGFIQPDERRPDGRNIFFHTNNSRVLSEDFPGDIDFLFDTLVVDRNPHEGERVVYNVSEDKKGPRAFQWNYADEYARAKALVAARPWEYWPLKRFVSHRQFVDGQPKVLWEGFDTNKMFERSAKLHAEGADRLIFQRLLVQGWKEIPSGELSAQPQVIKPEDQHRLDRFELARQTEVPDSSFSGNFAEYGE
ncbi:MAG: Cold-shock DNA-binding domain [Candidatus Paceibacter sp.]|jgi:cold shock CspA family protein|nr:Cold-shock DNA-binding domain [Candidatus Paceibacter sp.]